MGHLFLAVTLEGFKKHLQAKNSRITEKYLTAYQNAWAEIAWPETAWAETAWAETAWAETAWAETACLG